MADIPPVPAPPPAATPVVAPEFPFVFIARDAFNGFVRGDRIEDPAVIADIIDSHLESYVVRVAK